MNTQSLDLFAVVIIAILAMAMPPMGVYDMRRLRRWLKAGRADARQAIYRQILIFQWVLALGLLGWWLGMGRTLGDAGLRQGFAGWQWLAAGLGLVGFVAIVVQFVMVRRDPEQLRTMSGSMGDLADIAPRSASELRHFDLVAVTAGICEEILYRGLLMGALVPLAGLWPAVAVSSLIFGLGHIYQGPVGFLKTALVGLVMALLTVFSGSLWVAMVLHVVVDLTSGRLMGRALALDPAPAD